MLVDMYFLLFLFHRHLTIFISFKMSLVWTSSSPSIIFKLINLGGKVGGNSNSRPIQTTFLMWKMHVESYFYYFLLQSYLSIYVSYKISIEWTASCHCIMPKSLILGKEVSLHKHLHPFHTRLLSSCEKIHVESYF